MAGSIISITSESPHGMANGYSLRVHKLLTNAALRTEAQVHCIAPVTAAGNEAALAWAEYKNIHFHGVLLGKEMDYDRNLRGIFRQECNRILSSIITQPSVVIVHGLISIIDFADLKLTHSWVADLIDEAGPLMVRNVVRNLRNGKLIEFLRSVKYLFMYYSKAIDCFGKYKNITVVAHDDAKRLRKLLRSKEITVIPNGVDMPVFSRCNTSFGRPVVLFHGVYRYDPNEEAALFLIKKVAPLLEKRCPECKMVLAGRYPTKRMFDAAHFSPNVEIVGEVEDMSEYLLAASIGIYPVFTRTGLQNKILEAWSHRLPVVTTPEILSVFRAFSQDADQCALTAFTAREFVASIIELLDDPLFRSKMAAKSFEFVERNFSWQGVVEQFFQLNKSNNQ